METKIIFLAIISYINADHINTNLLPPDLPPANVANIFHESGITLVSPTFRNLEISSSAFAPPLPITHAFGFISHNSNSPQERTLSAKPVTHRSHASISAFNIDNGINSNINGRITFHRDDHSPPISHDVNVHLQSTPTDVVQARFVENENYAVHEINSRTQHFEYKVPLVRTVPQHHNIETHEHITDHHHHNDDTEDTFNQRNSIVQHSTYGVPSQISSQLPLQLPSQTPSQLTSQTSSQLPSQIHSHLPSQIPSQLPSQINLPSQTPSHFPSQLPSQISPQDEEPTHIPSQDEIDALPVFQNDKFLSPIVRHTNTPTTTHSNIQPPAQTIDNIFDTSFRSNPTTDTRVNTFEPSAAQHGNNPTTLTSEHTIDGNNHYSNRFSLSDGTKISEQGKLISPVVGWENIPSKSGEYEYISPEGIPVHVKWIADHEGFRVLP